MEVLDEQSASSDEESRGGERKNQIFEKGDVNGALERSVQDVRLRGSYDPGAHQELLCTLSDGKLLRISRTNGSDTFQIGATEDGGTLVMPNLQRAVPRHPKDKAYKVKRLKKVFKKVHDRMEKYSHGDCQVFAQAIWKEVTCTDPRTGGPIDIGRKDLEEDFM
jgi:hypothetical protein